MGLVEEGSNQASSARSAPGPFPNWSTRIRAGVVLGLAAAYALAFLALYPMMSTAAGALSVFPVTLAGWLLGLRGGIFGGLLVGVINISLFGLVEGFGWAPLARGAPVTMVFMAAAALVGWLSDLLARVRVQSTQLQADREALKAEITTRTRVEASLRESEGRFKAQYKGIPVPTYTWRKLGEEFQLVDCNDAAKAYTHGRIGELLGRSAGELYADAPEIVADLARCFNEQATIRGEMRYRLRSTGEIREVIVHYVHVSPDGVMVHTEDVTERKRAEEESRLLQTITLAVSEAEDLQTALEVTLRKVCEATGWVLGQAWVLRADGAALECHPAWYCGGDGLEQFRSACERFAFPPGVGLIGRVWASKAPVWLTDVESDPDFLRVLPVKEAGLKAAMGIPVLAGDEIVAVIEFFMPEPREEDGRLVQLVSAVAAQLGTLIQRKRTEDELRQWAHVFEHAEWGIHIVSDETKTITNVNPAFARMHGYTVDELIGKPIRDLVAPECRDGLRERVHGVSEKGYGSFESRHVRKDGTTFPVWLDITVIKDADGAPLCRAVNVLDITEQKRIESALRESEARFKALSDATVDGVAIVEDGRVIEANQRLTRMLGYELSELTGKSVFELAAPESREIVLKKIVSSDVRTYEAIALRKDGSTFPMSVCGKLSQYRGRPVRVIVFQDLTRRKQAEEKLRKSATMLAEAQRLVHLGSWERDVKTNEMTWSNEMYRILGLEPREVAPTVGLFLARIHPLDRDAVAAKIQAVQRDPRPGEYHCRVIRGDGEERIIHMRGDVVCDASGQLVRTFGTIQDVTEFKRAEEALDRSAKMLGEAQRLAHIGSWERELKTGELNWSDEMYRILGTRPREVAPTIEVFLERVHPDDRESVRPRLEAISRDLKPAEYHCRVIRADGAERFIHVRGDVVLDSAGQVIKTFGTMQDVTEVRQAEEALKGTAAMLAKAERIARLGSWDRDFQVNTLVWSDEFYRLLAFQPQEFPASRERFLECVHPDDREPFESFLEEAGRGSRPDIFDCRVIRRDGVERIFQTRRDAIVDAEGRPLRRVGTVQDVTELRRAEAEVQRHREVLAQTEKLAAMGQLLAGVAHELNNPLAVVVGQADLLQAIVGEGDLGKRAAEIARAAERCARIVKNFLALARQQPPERASIALDQVLQESVDMLAYHLNVDNVEVALDLAGDVPELWADPSQLNQLVVNLVCNAHQAMLDGPLPRRLTVTSRFEPRERRVWFEIADTGPGIAPEILPRVFEPFFTTKPTGKGTGLGLSLCQGIVERHGGVIEVRSEPGQGAAFRVTFPLGAPAESGDGQEPDEEVQAGEPGTILVVEDEPGIAQILVELLSADGHRVECAESGALALQKLESRPYDVILSDIRMPDLDGPMLYRELERRHPELCERVIFLTGDVLGPDTGEFLARTGRPSLGKPFSSRAVVRAVRSVLTTSREVERLMERLSEVLEAQGFVEHHRRSQLKA